MAYSGLTCPVSDRVAARVGRSKGARRKRRSARPADAAAVADAALGWEEAQAFGAEAREDQRLVRVVDKWRRRTERVWVRATLNGTMQMAALLALRAAVVGTGLWLWWEGRATPGDIAYVLTTFFVIQGYLRDVGMHIRNLQRSSSGRMMSAVRTSQSAAETSGISGSIVKISLFAISAALARTSSPRFVARPSGVTAHST